ncbi:MAG TPA: hypothetical protein VJ233_15400 [Hyphomicrobiaceae bacterium]|nr:hypothetical protein [Hyphomicrobiaceae bacterium]
MAESAMTKERAALEATRSRLEAALSEDENWRALKQLRTQPAGDQGAQSRLRDARLALLLLSNPLFRAWKHVDDAIEDLRKNDSLSMRLSATGTLAPAHVLTSGSLAKEVTSLADLSRGIARLIQRGMPEADHEPALATIETDAAEADAARQTREPPPAAAEESQEPAVKRQPLAAPVEKPTARKRDEPALGYGADAEEATVMFVTRESASTRSSGTDRTSARHGQPNVSAVDQPGVEGASVTPYPPSGLVEEAEVTILTEEGVKQRQETAQRDGNLRRFRKALLGE